MSGFNVLHDIKIRHISYIILSFLILILVGSFVVLRFFGISEKDITKTEIAYALKNKLDKHDPKSIDFNDKIAISEQVDQISTGILLLHKGGEFRKDKELLNLDQSKGEFKAYLGKLSHEWDEFSTQLLDINEQRGRPTNDAISSLNNTYKTVEKSAAQLIPMMNKELQATKNRQTIMMIAVFVFSLLVFGLIYFIMRHLVLGPIYVISQTSRKLAKGNLTDKIPLDSKNEIGYIAQNINSLADILKNASDFTHEITKGNLKADYSGLDQLSDENTENIAYSLLSMRDHMIKSAEGDKQRSWINEGMAKFADILRKNSDNQKELSYEVITQLVKYMGISQGAFFILNEDEEGKSVLELTGAYAYERQKRMDAKINIGEGLIGQCYLEKEKIYLTEVPDHYITIKSGLGDANPRALLIVPMKVNDEIMGILELAALQPIPEYQIEFVERLGETIASTISTVKTNEQTKKLLSESQQMTEQLQSAEEEMRQNMEEMEATQEEMRRAQRELEMKEANMNALINNTDDSIITIDTNYKVMIINNVIKNRYKGTEFEGIDAGTNALDLLGSVRDEWKGYYDKALSGEKLEFIIKSSVKGEDAFRQYNLNPIKDHNGKIVGASIFSRDVTKLTMAENKAKRVLHDLEQKNNLLSHVVLLAELSPDKKTILANDHLLTLTGYQANEVLHRHFNLLLGKEEYLRAGLSHMEEGKLYEEEVELRAKDGSLHKKKSTCTAVFDDEGVIEKYVFIFY